MVAQKCLQTDLCMRNRYRGDLPLTIGHALHTHRPKEYYAAPTPVGHPSNYLVFLSLRDSIGAGSAKTFIQKKLAWNTLGSG